MIVALPVPLAGAAKVIQSNVLVADHVHEGAEAVIATVPVTPSGGAATAAGEMVKVHGAGGAACEIVNVCPATVKVPVRAAPVLGATLNDTVPLPAPLAPPTSVIQSAFAVADHAQVAADAVTLIEPVPPASVMLCETGAIDIVHDGGGDGAP